MFSRQFKSVSRACRRAIVSTFQKTMPTNNFSVTAKMPGFFDSVLYPREFIALPLEFALLSFHISVTVLIAIKMRQGIVTYTHAFFHLYLIQCIANYLCYATVGLRLRVKGISTQGTPGLFFTCGHASCKWISTLNIFSTRVKATPQLVHYAG